MSKIINLIVDNDRVLKVMGGEIKAILVPHESKIFHSDVLCFRNSASEDAIGWTAKIKKMSVLESNNKSMLPSGISLDGVFLDALDRVGIKNKLGVSCGMILESYFGLFTKCWYIEFE